MFRTRILTNFFASSFVQQRTLSTPQNLPNIDIDSTSLDVVIEWLPESIVRHSGPELLIEINRFQLFILIRFGELSFPSFRLAFSFVVHFQRNDSIRNWGFPTGRNVASHYSWHCMIAETTGSGHYGNVSTAQEYCSRFVVDRWSSDEEYRHLTEARSRINNYC